MATRSIRAALLIASFMPVIGLGGPPASPAKEQAAALPMMTWYHPVLAPKLSGMVLLCTVVKAKTERQVYETPYWDVRLRIDERLFVDGRYTKRLDGVAFLDSGDFQRRVVGERIVVFAGGEPYEGTDFLLPCWSGTATNLGILLPAGDHEQRAANESLLKQLRAAAKGGADEADLMEAFAGFCPQGVAAEFVYRLRRQQIAREEAAAPPKTSK